MQRHKNRIVKAKVRWWIRHNDKRIFKGLLHYINNYPKTVIEVPNLNGASITLTDIKHFVTQLEQAK